MPFFKSINSVLSKYYYAWFWVVGYYVWCMAVGNDACMIHEFEGEWYVYDFEGETAAAEDDWCKLLEVAAVGA